MIAPLKEISAPTRQLSAYVTRALRQPLPPAVLEKARQHILDTFAAMISGTRLAPGRLAIDYVGRLGGGRQCSIVGTPLSSCPVHAALANGMLAHADETDDSHAPSRTHPGCAVVPAALAAAEAVHATGQDFIRAIVLGYDVAARINYALGPEALALASRSTHSIGGTFGAGAAAAALLRLDDRKARHMLSLCAQQACGIGCHVRDAEHLEKAFDFGGMPARNGVTAAMLVAAGMTGVDDAFSGERNFFDAYASEPKPDALSEGLGERFEILTTNIKKWPVGSPAQAALDAMTVLMEQGLAADEIAAIDVQLPGRSARTVDRAQMPNINVQHLLSMLVIDGALSFESIHDRERMRDPAILALARKIAVIASADLEHARPRRQAIVTIRTTDGRTLSQRTLAVRGSSDNPMTQAEVESKAFDLMATVLGTGRTEDLIAAIARLERIVDIGELRGFWLPGKDAHDAAVVQ